MAILALTLSWLLAGVLIWAGLEKARNWAPTVSTTISLRVPRRLAHLVVMLVLLAEIGLGFGLVFVPHAACTRCGIMFLGLLFAAAGLIALHLDQPIRCNCLGLTHNGRLGRIQIAAFPAWVASAMVFQAGFDEPLPLFQGAIRLSVLALAVASLRAASVWRARFEAIWDRQSAKEMYLWRY